MGIGVYKYTDDGGRTFQVALPDEFAVALSYQAADPNDPYLPSSISPRWLSYIAVGKQLYRAVICPNRALFATPPQLITADGSTWNLASLVGEQFMSFPNGNVVVISGTQGPRGFDGAAALPRFSNTMSADVAINSAAAFSLIQITGLVAGTYLVNASVMFQSGAAAGRFDTVITSVTPGSLNWAYQSGDINGANDYINIASCAIVTLPAAGALILSGFSSITTGFARRNSPAGSPGTMLTAVKIA